jgi:hypothetical protein
MDIGQVAVSQYAGIRIVFGKGLQQFVESMLLSFCTGVGRTAFLIEPSFVDNAQGTTIVACRMDTLKGFREQGNDGSVKTDIVVVATLTELILSAFYQALHTEGLIASGSRAVHHDELHYLQTLVIH